MATSAPAPVATTSTQSQTVSNVSELTFAQRDPAGYKDYVAFRTKEANALTEKYTAEEVANFGANASATQPRQAAIANATLAANKQFAQQIAAAGAGTVIQSTNPLLPTQPVPPTSSNTAPVNPAVNPQVPQPQDLPNPAPGESRRINTLDDFGEPIPPPPGFFDQRRVAAPAPAPTPSPYTDPMGTGDAGAIVNAGPVSPVPLVKTPAPPVYSPYPEVDQLGNPTGYNPNTAPAAPTPAAVKQQAGTESAQAQGQIQSQQKQSTTGDWRVKLRLAPGSTYLYNDPKPGILAPLADNGGSGGVVFPYTPAITTQYKANYNPYELTHSNYKGYFYQNSSVGELRIQAVFTAQDTFEANYLLAVIHFFRSVTKMFYGQDAQRGAPPPLVFLDGYGEYQFNKSPCVVQSFDYVLPADVDYIRALNPSNSGVNLESRRNNQSPAANQTGSSGYRLDNAGLSFGAVNSVPPPTNLQTNAPTYVPTKMEIAIVLLPMQTRAQVSRQFSLKSYANGDLLKGGFW